MQSVETLTRLFFYNEREVNSMKLNKERFLRTELGSSLKDCVTSWDIALDACREHAYYTDEYKRNRKVADWCQAQWKVYKMAIQQFYGVEYCFTRTDKYYGLVTENETDWLFKVERKESKDNGKEIQEIAL